MTAKNETSGTSGSENVRGAFAETRWTIVLAARDGQDPTSRAALAQLCQDYWYPLYVYARRHGHGREDAEDVVQEFFAAFIEKDFLESVDPGKGKFRSFLLTAFKNFLANAWDKKQALKRGGAHQVVSLDAAMAELHFKSELHQAAPPDALYDRVWAQTILNQTLDMLRKEYFAAGKRDLLEAIECHLEGERDQMPPYAEIARQFEVSVSAIKMAVKRMRKRYGELLRGEIRHTVDDPSEIDQEVRYLMTVLASNQRFSEDFT